MPLGISARSSRFPLSLVGTTPLPALVRSGPITVTS